MIELILRCPACNAQFRWFSEDFESRTSCPKCNYKREGWFFWHRPVGWRPEKHGVLEIWTIGAHYPNTALCLNLKKFLEFFKGGGGLWHGGGPYIWVTVQQSFGDSVVASAKVILVARAGFDKEQWDLKELEEAIVLLKNFRVPKNKAEWLAQRFEIAER